MRNWSFVSPLQCAMAGLVCAAMLAAACSDDEAAPRSTDNVDAGEARPDAAPPSEATDAGDAGDAGDVIEPCSPGDERKATVGAGGAKLSLCGATLEVPEGALEAGTPVAITVVAPPGAPWFEHELSGPVFRFTPDTGPLDLPAKISFTRDTTKTRGPVLAQWFPEENGWGEYEACFKDDQLSLNTVHLGTFGLMQDVNSYPPSASDQGAANVSLTLGDVTTSWTVPGNGRYSVYEPSADSRSFILVARREEGEHTQQLDIRGSLRNGEPATVVQVSWLTTDFENGKSWSWVEPIHGPPTSFTMTETSPGVFSGEIHVIGHYGEETTNIDVTFTTTPVKYRPPPSYSCGRPEGDPR